MFVSDFINGINNQWHACSQSLGEFTKHFDSTLYCLIPSELPEISAARFRNLFVEFVKHACNYSDCSSSITNHDPANPTLILSNWTIRCFPPGESPLAFKCVVRNAHSPVQYEFVDTVAGFLEIYWNNNNYVYEANNTNLILYEKFFQDKQFIVLNDLHRMTPWIAIATGALFLSLCTGYVLIRVFFSAIKAHFPPQQFQETKRTPLMNPKVFVLFEIAVCICVVAFSRALFNSAHAQLKDSYPLGPTSGMATFNPLLYKI